MKRISKKEHKGGTDCAKPQTQEDQVYEELKTDQHGCRVGGEPGEVGRGWITQQLRV